MLRPWPLRHRNATFLSFTFRSNLLGLWKVKGQVKVSTKAIFPSYWELIQQSLCEMTVHIVYFCPNNPHVFQVHIIFNPQALNSCVSCGPYHNRCLGNKKYERWIYHFLIILSSILFLLVGLHYSYICYPFVTIKKWTLIKGQHKERKEDKCKHANTSKWGGKLAFWKDSL